MQMMYLKQKKFPRSTSRSANPVIPIDNGSKEPKRIT